MSAASFKIAAPAKINLFLHVTGKRPDGYHLLQSLMVFAETADILEFSSHDGFLLETVGPFAPAIAAPEGNLVWKAASLLAREYKVPLKAKIILHKNIPVAAGLGGGSSDAAAALIGISRLWGLPEDMPRLQKIAPDLGADVPACLVRRPVFAEGIGEKLQEVTGLPPLHFVLANPGTPSPTAAVFRYFRPPFSAPVELPGDKNEWMTFLKDCRNDLTAAATKTCPEIAGVLQALADTSGCLFSRLSGSGATCFGIYDTAEKAQTAAALLKKNRPQWWVTTE